MDSPVRVVAVLAALMCSGVRSQAGDTQVSSASAIDAPAVKARKMSPRVAEMLADAATKNLPKPAVRDEAQSLVAIPRVENDRPANDIVRLPNYIVRERRPPKPSEVLSNAELARIGMDKFIGPENGLDRGVLNLFTVAALWKKIPVLGRFPLVGFATNEERGLALYRAALKAEEWENLSGLMSPGLSPTAAAPVKK